MGRMHRRERRGGHVGCSVIPWKCCWVWPPHLPIHLFQVRVLSHTVIQITSTTFAFTALPAIIDSQSEGGCTIGHELDRVVDDFEVTLSMSSRNSQSSQVSAGDLPPPPNYAYWHQGCTLIPLGHLTLFIM